MVSNSDGACVSHSWHESSLQLRALSTRSLQDVHGWPVYQTVDRARAAATSIENTFRLYPFVTINKCADDVCFDVVFEKLFARHRMMALWMRRAPISLSKKGWNDVMSPEQRYRVAKRRERREAHVGPFG